MRRILPVLLVLLCALPAGAQDDESGPRLVRALHLGRSGPSAGNLCQGSLGCPTSAILFDDAVGATYTAEIGGQAYTVAGNPTRVSAPIYPAGDGVAGYAWNFDGAGDYLSIADDPSFEQQSFSVFMCLAPGPLHTFNLSYSGKYEGNQRSWLVYTADTDRVTFLISDDGTLDAGHTSSVDKTGVIAKNRISCFTASYRYVTDGASVGNVWVDEAAAATSNTMSGPPFNGTAALNIAAYAAGVTGFLDARVFVWAYYPGAATQADHLLHSRHFRGLYASDGINVVSTTAATMPSLPLAYAASGVEPFIVDVPANTNQALAYSATLYGLHGASALVNYIHRWSMETCDGSNHPSGYPFAQETAGDGTAAIDCSTTHKAHGAQSAKMVLTGTTSTTILGTACGTAGLKTDLLFHGHLYVESGTPNSRVILLQYDDGACGNYIAGVTLAPHGGTYLTGLVSGWNEVSGVIHSADWNAAAASYLVGLYEEGNGGVTVYWDAVSVYPGLVPKLAQCGSDADADASCSTMVVSTPDPTSANGATTWVVEAFSPWAGTDLTAASLPFFLSGTGATNVIFAGVSVVTQEAYISHIDGSGNVLYAAPDTANWAANTLYKVLGRWDGQGLLDIYWSSAWRSDRVGSSGSAKRSSAQSKLYLSNNGTVGTDVTIKSAEVYSGTLP